MWLALIFLMSHFNQSPFVLQSSQCSWQYSSSNSFQLVDHSKPQVNVFMFAAPTIMELSTNNLSTLKVVLYSLSIGIGTSGASVWVFKRISILMMSLKTRVFEWFKNAYWACSRCCIFFDNWHMDKAFSYSCCLEKASNFTHTLM